MEQPIIVKKHPTDPDMYEGYVKDYAGKVYLANVTHEDMINLCVTHEQMERLENGEEIKFKLVEVED
jgi:hypothetical protein